MSALGPGRSNLPGSTPKQSKQKSGQTHRTHLSTETLQGDMRASRDIDLASHGGGGIGPSGKMTHFKNVFIILSFSNLPLPKLDTPCYCGCHMTGAVAGWLCPCLFMLQRYAW